MKAQECSSVFKMQKDKMKNYSSFWRTQNKCLEWGKLIFVQSQRQQPTNSYRHFFSGGGAFKKMKEDENDFGGFILSAGKAPAPAPWNLKF